MKKKTRISIASPMNNQPIASKVDFVVSHNAIPSLKPLGSVPVPTQCGAGYGE